MPHLAQPYDYNALASSLVNKLLPILGRDAVIQTSYSIPEIQISENQRIGESEDRRARNTQNTRIVARVVRGDAAVAFDQLVEEFRDLSPFVVDRVMKELEVQHLASSS